MKKIISLILALALVLCMSAVAFAAGNTKLQKTYTLVGDGAVTPSVTFNFSATFDGYKSDIGDALVTTGYPDISGDLTIGTVSFSSADFTNGKTSDTKDVAVTLPTYSNVGYYYYTLSETVTDPVAGVSYANGTLKMVVSVLRDDTSENPEAFDKTYYVYVLNDSNEKTSSLFTNTYSAGKLQVKKMVAGSLGDKTATYPATVTLTSANAVSSTIKVGGEEKTITWTKNDGTGKYTATISLSLRHDTPVTIENIPADTIFEVVETGATSKTEGETTTITYGDGYTVTYDGATGTVDTTTKSATITNTKNGSVDTGITTDSLPYILLLGVVALAALAFLGKKRVKD